MRRAQTSRVSAVGQSIRRIVMEQPGIHFRGLGRAAKLSSAGQLRHHLDRLERQGVLIEVEDGRYKRYFVAGEHDPKLRSEIARFARVVPRRIAKLLLVNPMNRTELRRSLGCADSTLGYHLTRMVMLGDLAKSRGPNCCRYSLTSEDLVRKMLALQVTADEATPATAATAPHRQPEDDESVPNPLRPGRDAPGDMPFPARLPSDETVAPPIPDPAPDFMSPPQDDAAAGSP